MYRTILYAICAAVLATNGCSGEKMQKTEEDNVTHYQVEKVHTEDTKTLEKIKINGSPVPPEGYSRPLAPVQDNTTSKGGK